MRYILALLVLCLLPSPLCAAFPQILNTPDVELYDKDVLCFVSINNTETAGDLFIYTSSETRSVKVYEGMSYFVFKFHPDGAGNFLIDSSLKDSALTASLIDCYEEKIETISGSPSSEEIEMISLMLGGLFGIAFVLAAVWRF